MSERVLVTGGLGFLGFHLCRRLLEIEPECRLTIVDNQSSTESDLSALADHASILIEDFRQFRPHGKYDVVCHLAGPVGSLAISL